MEYKWVAMVGVIIASLMGSINMSIVMIALPAIFNGIHINPIKFISISIMDINGLWIGYSYFIIKFWPIIRYVWTSKDVPDWVFNIFSLASILLYLTPSTGDMGAIEIIVFRIVQAVGAALFMANSAAILTDAFPSNERGKALGINTVAVMAGIFLGLIIGGILAVFDWRYVFLISVPFGIIGTVWSYYKLKEISIKAEKTKIDILGNLTFVLGITLVLVGVTYGLIPYGNNSMGWNNPWVITSMILGLISMILFGFVENRVESPNVQIRFI